MGALGMRSILSILSLGMSLLLCGACSSPTPIQSTDLLVLLDKSNVSDLEYAESTVRRRARLLSLDMTSVDADILAAWVTGQTNELRRLVGAECLSFTYFATDRLRGIALQEQDYPVFTFFYHASISLSLSPPASRDVASLLQSARGPSGYGRDVALLTLASLCRFSSVRKSVSQMLLDRSFLVECSGAMVLLKQRCGSQEHHVVTNSANVVIDPRIAAVFEFGLPVSEYTVSLADAGAKGGFWVRDGLLWRHSEDMHVTDENRSSASAMVRFDVATSPAGRWALVYVDLHFGPLSGRGHMYVLYLKNDRWQVVSVQPTWIS
jgi:hypothetical protein